jgi:hypothetical protein
MASFDYNNPQASLNYLLAPNPLPETDTRAAESAVASGGMLGSPFAANNRLRLRDSERVNRLALGQQLLQPYLNRASAESMQSKSLAADAARQAVSEAGLNQRLSTEGQQRLQLALLSGNQQAAHDLLSEAGLDRRQASALASHLQDTILTNQQRSFEALLPYAQQNYQQRLATLPRYPSQQNPVVMNGGAWSGGYGGGYSPVTASGSPLHPPAQSSSSGGTMNMVDSILKQYGIGGTSTTSAPAPVPYSVPTGRNPNAEFNWSRQTDPGTQALSNWYDQPEQFGPVTGQFDWTQGTAPDVATMQSYYE